MCVTGVSVCMSVLDTITHSLYICHLAIKLYCIVLYCIVISGLSPGYWLPVYVASKHAMIGYTTSCAVSQSLSFWLREKEGGEGQNEVLH